jgi:hypothetical protein
MGRSRRRGYAWVIILVADAGVLVYGVMAAVAPRALIPGYESYSSRTWPALVAADTQTAAFVLLLFRLLGAYNVAFAVLAIAIAATAFRRGEGWAWWALLVGNTLGFGAPMIYDQPVGEIGVFEVLEVVGIAAIYAALAATVPARRSRRPSDLVHR